MIGEADGVGEREIDVEAFPRQMCAGCPGGGYGRQPEVAGSMYGRNMGESGPTSVGIGTDDANAYRWVYHVASCANRVTRFRLQS
jgi:hypothetical protein